MKVILNQDVKDQGKKGQLIDVSDGYARNFLIPRKLAVAATAENLATMKQQERARAKKMEAEKAAALETAEKLQNVVVKIKARSGAARSDGGSPDGNGPGKAGGKLFGAVTSKEISEALLEQHGIEVEKHKIVQEENIKAFGSFEVKCKLGFEIAGTINVLVIEA